MTLIAAYLIAGGAMCGAVSLAAVMGYVIGRTRALEPLAPSQPAVPHPVDARPGRRRGDHIRWRHQLDRDLAAANNTAVEAGLLRELDRPQWATNPTEMHPRQEA